MYVQAVRTLVADHFAVAIEQVRDDARFTQDLGADSLDMVQLAMRFEEEFGIVIDEDESESCLTVQDALDLLQMKLVKAA